jgi:hypothetical protein
VGAKLKRVTKDLAERALAVEGTRPGSKEAGR